MRPRVSQAALDRLASSWSRLDRARPVERAGVPQAVGALAEWMACALLVDESLAGLLGSVYLAARAEEPGGPPLPGLRYASLLVEHGRPLEDLVFAATGAPHVFWELYWRPSADLAAPPEEARWPDQRRAYADHLANQEVRTPAARMTTFLLCVSVAMSAARPQLEEA